MSCACGYYSSCPHACSSAQVKALTAQRERSWEDEDLQEEHQKDAKEEKEGTFR